MERRREKLITKKQCRFCLSDDESIRSVYARNQASNSVPLSLKIMSCVSVEVFPSDKMPQYICDRCRFFMDISYEFKQICRQADETILEFIQTGTPLEAVTWPPILSKIYDHHGAKSSQGVGIKTIVEGGATVEVTSQDNSESDEDEENVYSVKIGEGSDGASLACIKVVTSKESPEVAKEKPKQAAKGFSSVSKLARHVRSHAGERAYPCKYCDKSFIKSHHYTRHLKVKHTAHPGAIGASEQYRCEQCEDSFATQDDLIYHSAIHATQNLTCPLCQEKFENVDAVTSHIKSHVNGTEFMCDLCELVFTSKEKLDHHIEMAHDEELRQAQELGQDESSMEMEWKADEDDDAMNVREEDDQMVVEIKKADEFMLTNMQGESETYTEDKTDNTNSEESEVEATYTELSTVDTLNIVKNEPILSPVKTNVEMALFPATTPAKPAPAAVTAITPKPNSKVNKSIDSQTASILRKAEEIKRKTVQTPPAEISKKVIHKVETSNSVGASDKSLRLLEKELQELKRTTRNDVPKTPAKPVELRNNRRPQLHTSTPKIRGTEEKKSLLLTKSPALEKKLPERRAVKENKEPKEGKSNNSSVREDKETKVNANAKEEREKEIKERDAPKTIVKNGGNDKSVTDDAVRRSTRPSKIKDYAKMIRDRTQVSDEDTDDDDDDEEYVNIEKYSDSRPKTRRASVAKPTPSKPAVAKPTPTPTATPTPMRKRGRPRKNVPAEVPAKVKKGDFENEDDSKSDKMEAEESIEKAKEKQSSNDTDDSTTADDSSNLDNSKPADQTHSGVMVSPTGQTLKKIPIKSLPPGIKPLPLPRSMSGPGELCEMQIGKKVVKVQKIVMTKAEVEAMAKKGLVEMKDGTMVLKQGIKIPKSDPVAIKSTLVGEDGVKESLSKKETPVRAAPSRCDLGDEV